MQYDKRWFPRFAVKEGVTAMVSLKDGTDRQGPPVDISYTGAYIAKLQDLGYGDARVQFKIHDPNLDKTQDVVRECWVCAGRSGQTGGCALKFYTPLTGGELALIAEASHVSGSLELAREDYRIVSDEITHTQSCQSHLFIGAMAAISAWVIAAIGIGITNSLKSPVWIAIGVSFPYTLLTIAILATFEKANVSNLRKGFLAALTDYLKNNTAPPNYHGWSHLRLNRAECRSRFNNKLCPISKKSCWEAEKAISTHLTRGHHLISNIFDSFMAFVSFVYSCLFVLSSALLISVGISYWMRFKDKWPFLILSVTILVSVLITFLAIFLFSQLHRLRKGKKSAESYYCEWRAILRYCRSVDGIKQSVQEGAKNFRAPESELSAPQEAVPDGAIQAQSPRTTDSKTGEQANAADV